MLTICEANRVERIQLSNKVVAPEWASAKWKGIPHREVADLFVDTAVNAGLKVESEQWGILEKQQALVGGLTVSGSNFPVMKDAGYSMALVHDNTGGRALSVSAGAQVFVCTNGVITGTNLMRKRHTKGLDLHAEIEAVVMRTLYHLKGVSDGIEAMKKFRVDSAEEFFVEMGRRELMTWTRIGRAIKEYDDPSCPDFKQWKGTAWGIYNALNQVAKSIDNPATQVNSLQGLTSIFKEQGILQTQDVIDIDAIVN